LLPVIWVGARNDATRVADVARTTHLAYDAGTSASPLRQRSNSLPLLVIPFPAIDPVLISIGPFAIRWYALAYIAGIVLGWRLVRRLVQRPGWQLTPEAIDDLVFYVTLGIILGGRIGYVLFYQPGHYLSRPLDMLAVWHGGMSFHGGLLGVLVATWLFARKHKLAFFELTDALAVATPIGLFLGRIANFINAELWGRVTDVPWAVVFPTGGPEPRHPSQLYEATLEGLVLFAVMLWFAGRPYGPTARGRLSGVFLIGYALARIAAEFFRQPDVQIGYLAGGVTMGQLLSLPMLAFGIFLVLRARRRVEAPG
jgi:phosphatidylglycerol:prolipoprotein diacylglycerol transferase